MCLHAYPRIFFSVTAGVGDLWCGEEEQAEEEGGEEEQGRRDLEDQSGIGTYHTQLTSVLPRESMGHNILSIVICIPSSKYMDHI